jgi:hypothetical protein
VTSYSPDDIPATNIDIVTYTGSWAKARANHNIAFVEISPLDQRVWFGVDASPGLYRGFYNRRVRDYVGGPWRWLYSYSPQIRTFQQPSSAGPASVHYSDTAKYRDPATGLYYKFLMFEGYQPGSCDGVVAGFLYVTFSNDGICWTDRREVHRSGGPSFDCYPGHTNTIPMEQMQSIDAGDRLILVGVEGDVRELVPPVDETDGWGSVTFRHWTNMERTQTYVGWVSYTDPQSLNLYSPAEITNAGMFHPKAINGTAQNPNRYVPYHYFMNLSIAYDPSTGYLYMGRGYPYAYDRGSYNDSGWAFANDAPSGYVIPNWTQLQSVDMWGPNGYSNVEGCLPSPYTLPNRIQVYRMYLGSLSMITRLTDGTGTWQLVGDYGGNASYGHDYGWWPGLVAGQQNVGHDFGAVSFARDRAGNLLRNTSGQAQVFGAHTYKLSKSSGPCRITGLEREVLLSIP